MSVGDQLISVLVTSVGTIFSSLINAIFSSFIGPLVNAFATLVGLGTST